MKYSLVIGTLNRSIQIRTCLESIENQEIIDFEVIIVDQSHDDLTKKVVNQFLNTNIKYYHVDFKGLSKARNYALKFAEGEFICLMDDDAVYPAEFLSIVGQILDKSAKQIVSGIILSIDDRKTPFIDCSPLKEGELLEVKEIINYCPSAALIIPRSAFGEVGNFDVRLGVGNEFASGEETDFLLRAIDAGYKVRHSKLVKVYHPIKPIDYNNLNGVYKHAMGKGALVKIDFKMRKKHRLLNFALRNTLGMIIKWCFCGGNNRNMYKMRLSGFVEGYIRFDV